VVSDHSFLLETFLKKKNMAKSKLQKQEILRDLTAKINDSKSVVFTKFNGLGVKENEEGKLLIDTNDEIYIEKYAQVGNQHNYFN
jgi:hypothetical protein